MAAIKQLVPISGTLAQVRAALSTQEGLSAWWAKDTKAEPRVGAQLVFRFDPERFAAFDVTDFADTRIAWKCVDGMQEWIGTTITFDLTEKDGVTTVRFVHDGWDDSDYYMMCNATWGHLLFKVLRDYVEKGVRAPYFTYA